MERYIKYKNAELLTETVFPNKCRLCGDSIKPLKSVCEKCRNEIKVIGKSFCHKCGCNTDKCICNRDEQLYDGVRSPFVYEGSIKNGIHLWKFGGNIDSTQFFAASMAEFVKAELSNTDYDYITFVPQTEKEMSERKYNQAELLARVFAVYFEKDVTVLLKKVFETERQRNLPEILRRGNVLGVFDVVNPELIKDKKIILVDDIKTTGSVLNECAKMLLINGAESVMCVCIAVVEKKNKEEKK